MPDDEIYVYVNISIQFLHLVDYCFSSEYFASYELASLGKSFPVILE